MFIREGMIILVCIKPKVKMDSLTNEIIALLNKKQEAAFEVVFRLYYPQLVYFAKEYIDYEDAKYAVQDAFVAFWKKTLSWPAKGS